MAKFYGTIGYSETFEARPGVHVQRVIERVHSGDMLTATIRNQPRSDSTVQDLSISNRISIVMDPYVMSNYPNMLYVHFNGSRWNISSINLAYPRVELTLGGVYNGPTPEN